jgi:pimeloyl-ACP methyl ester carboxylesterase
MTIMLWASHSTESLGQSNTSPVIVFVHGRGQEGRQRSEVRSAFVDTFRETQRKWLGKEIVPAADYAFVWYADAIAADSTATTSSPGCAYAEQPTSQSAQDWRSKLIALATTLHLDGPLLKEFTEDTFRYFSSERRRCEADARLLEVVAQPSFQGRPLVVLAHSMGGIVTLASLKKNAEQLDPEDRLHIDRLVTVGTQVGQPLILKGLFGSYTEPPVPLPSTIAAWINIQNADDKLAFPAHASFAATDSRRVPQDVIIDTPRGPRHAIESYLGDTVVVRAVLIPWCLGTQASRRPGECGRIINGH